MKSEARNRLRSIVGKARKLVEEDIQSQLLRLGIKENELIPISRLEHLDDSLIEDRRRLEEAIHKEKSGNVSQKEAFERYVRHVGSTFINRVAAFRALEVRKLLSRETAIRREKYAGYSAREYEVSEREGINDPGEIAKTAFREACEEISEEIAVLFDLNNEYSILFPSTRVLAQVYDFFGKDIPDEDWLSDDVIGWIYQYYNSEARKEFKKKKRKPKPDDIPIINQFYTSYWIVKALVDNTLGRLWLESRGVLRKRGDGLIKVEKDSVEGFTDYLVPMNTSSQRGEVDPYKIKILDPACGSGHFLVYAFDVMFLIYREHNPILTNSQICELILENNLYGIDIDLRAVQLAALSLYLKAKTLSPTMKIKAMNLVCADARIIDGNMQKEFLKRLEPNLDLQRAFVKLFNELACTYHIGSLFQIRYHFKNVIEQSQYQTSLESFHSESMQSHIDKRSSETISTIEEMNEVLRLFEEEAMASQDMGTLLFAAETEKSTGLLSLLTQSYDIVLMNPPYGDVPIEAKQYLKKKYPRTHYDYYAAFIEQAVILCKKNGFIGMLTGRTFMFLRRFEKVRTQILYDDAHPLILFDLNSGPSDAVLDEATARWAATVVQVGSEDRNNKECSFFRLTSLLGEKAKISGLEEAITNLYNGEQHDIEFHLPLNDLKKLPRMPYTYWVPREITDLFEKFPPLDCDNAGDKSKIKIATLKLGLTTANDARFVRHWWEVQSGSIGYSRKDTHHGKNWIPYIKGGDAFYSDSQLVVNWENNGDTIKNFERSTIRNEEYYFSEGLVWSDIVSSVRMDFRQRPIGSIFSNKAHSLVLKEGNYDSLMGFLNSNILACLITMLDPTMHCRTLGYVAHLPIPRNALNNLVISESAKTIASILRRRSTADETSPTFTKPFLLQKLDDTSRESKTVKLGDLVALCRDWERKSESEILGYMKRIDTEVIKLYNLSNNAQNWANRELNEMRGGEESIKFGFRHSSDYDYVTRLFSFYIKNSLEESQDGITLLHDLVTSIRSQLSRDFENPGSIESQTVKILGKPIDRWLLEDFFPKHVSMYKRRPKIWQITSEKKSSRKDTQPAFVCFLMYQKLNNDTLHKVRSKYLKVEMDAARWTANSIRKRISEAEVVDSSLAEQLVEAEAILEELEKFDAAIKDLTEPSKEQSTPKKPSDWVTEKVAEISVNGWSPVIDYGVLVNIKPLQVAGVLHKDARRIK